MSSESWIISMYKRIQYRKNTNGITKLYIYSLIFTHVMIQMRNTLLSIHMQFDDVFYTAMFWFIFFNYIILWLWMILNDVMFPKILTTTKLWKQWKNIILFMIDPTRVLIFKDVFFNDSQKNCFIKVSLQKFCSSFKNVLEKSEFSSFRVAQRLRIGFPQPKLCNCNVF